MLYSLLVIFAKYYYDDISRRMIWAGHAAQMRNMINAYDILSENLKRINHLEHTGVDWMIILNRS